MNGLWLAALVVGQFFISTEILVVSGVVGAMGAVVAIVVARGLLWRARHALAVAGGVALAATTVVLAYPAWFALAGPRHFSGQPWPLNYVGQAPGGLVSTGAGVHQVNAFERLIGYSNPTPIPSYVGWALLVFLAVSLPVWRRRTLAWCALIGGAFAWTLSWESRKDTWRGVRGACSTTCRS